MNGSENIKGGITMKTFADIQKLAMNEPVIHNCLMSAKSEGLSREQALINMVMILTDQKNHYFNEVVKLHQNKEPQRGGLVNPDGGDYPLKWMGKPEE